MAALILPRRFYEQPQRPSDVKPEWLSRGLVGFWGADGSAWGKNAVRGPLGDLSPVGGAALQATTNGMGFDLNGTSQYLTNTSNAVATNVPLTFLIRLYVDGFPTSSARIFDVSTGTTANDVIGLQYSNPGPARIVSQHYDGGTNAEAAFNTSITGQWVTLAGRFSGLSLRELFIDGANVASNSTTVAAPSGVDRVTISYAPWASGEFFDGRVAWAMLATQAWSDAEIRAVTQQPFGEVLRATPRRIYFNVAAGGGFSDSVLSAAGLAASTLAAQAIAKAAASSAGVAASSLIAQAVAKSALSAAGTSSASAVGQSLYQATVTGAGLATATFGGKSVGVSSLSSSGVGASNWTGKSLASSTITAAGIAAASWVTSGLTDAVFAAAGLGAAAWAGKSIAKGAFTSAASSAASWVSLVTGYAEAAFQMAGSGAAALAGRAVAQASSAISGIATAAFGGQTLKQGAFSSAGSSTSAWAGKLIAGAVLASTGIGTATYAGQATVSGSLYANGSSVVNWIEGSTTPEPPSMLVALGIRVYPAICAKTETYPAITGRTDLRD